MGHVPFSGLLKQLGGWPVLMGDEWIPQAFDWQDTIAKLRQYNNDILVAIWVGPDGKNSDDYIVQVRKAMAQCFVCISRNLVFSLIKVICFYQAPNIINWASIIPSLSLITMYS